MEFTGFNQDLSPERLPTCAPPCGVLPRHRTLPVDESALAACARHP